MSDLAQYTLPLGVLLFFVTALVLGLRMKQETDNLIEEADHMSELQNSQERK